MLEKNYRFIKDNVIFCVCLIQMKYRVKTIIDLNWLEIQCQINSNIKQNFNFLHVFVYVGVVIKLGIQIYFELICNTFELIYNTFELILTFSVQRNQIIFIYFFHLHVHSNCIRKFITFRQVLLSVYFLYIECSLTKEK